MQRHECDDFDSEGTVVGVDAPPAASDPFLLPARRQVGQARRDDDRDAGLRAAGAGPMARYPPTVAAGRDGRADCGVASHFLILKSLYKNAKDPTLSILGHHGGRRKVASLRPPFSTPATPRDKPEPAGPFPSSIERAPPLFVRIPAG